MGRRPKADAISAITGYAQIDTTKNTMIAQFERMKPRDQLDFLKRIGVGVQEFHPIQQFATCARCGELKPVSEFYSSTETGVAQHITPICKQCAKVVACGTDINGNMLSPTKATTINAMEWLRKPFIDNLYSQCVATSATGGKFGAFDSYMQQISRQAYIGQNFRANSDFYNVNKAVVLEEEEAPKMAPINEDAAKAFEKNKMDCQRLLGYLPYENEEPSDQPYLYADLVNFLGSVEDVTENFMRVQTMIGIVRWYLQITKIDNQIAKLSQQSMEANMATIKGLQATKSQIVDTISKSADDSKISLKSNRDNIKGANTFTGKLSKLRDLNLRASYVNGFDLETCKAMQQVADISNASILKQLNLDESEWSDMVAEQRKMITKLTDESHGYQEAARIILKENLDLRETLKDNGLLNDESLTDLNDIITRYWDSDEGNIES